MTKSNDLFDLNILELKMSLNTSYRVNGSCEPSLVLILDVLPYKDCFFAITSLKE